MNFLMTMELVDSAPDTLFGIVPDRTGVRHHDIGVVHILGAVVTGLFENGENNFRVIYVHLAAVSLDIYLFVIHNLHAFLIKSLAWPLNALYGTFIAYLICKVIIFINFFYICNLSFHIGDQDLNDIRR